jgi:hypothetical protein
MSSDLTTVSRQLARASLSWPFDVEAHAQTVSREAVAHALDGYRKALVPAKSLTKAERQSDQQSLAEIVRSIGLRLRPDFSEDQARMWIASIVEALEDQPLRIALAAARDAKHLPIRFPGELHAVLVERCAVHQLAYASAIRNLERLLARLDQGPALTASPEAQREAAQLDLDELQTLPSHLRSLGLSGGWITEEPDGSIRWATEAEQEAHAQRKLDERNVARARESEIG